MISRRRFLELIAIGAGAASGLAAPRALATPEPEPSLDPESYSHGLDVLAHHFPGENRPGKLQMMALGERRYLFQWVFHTDTWNFLRGGGQIIDVTDPLEPVVVNENAFRSFSIQVAYNRQRGRWVLMTSQTLPFGPPWWMPGLRGVRFYDVSDPTDVSVISEYSTDGGSADRWFQSGSGTHRDYYDGGRYAYLGAAPDEEFYFPDREAGLSAWSRSLQVVDVGDLSRPRQAARFWAPGQRVDEAEARAGWRSRGDPDAFDNFHGPLYVPRRVEDGGRYGYGGFGTFGVLIFDLSDPTQPRPIGHWDTEEYIPGPMIPHHTVDVTRVDRGFVITSPESIAMGCAEPWHDSWILDVRNPSAPRALARLPRPTPPPEAPYDDFCAKPGRFGPHNAPHLKAPGRPHPDFTAYTCFNAGLQCYDLSDPGRPRRTAWFIPPQIGRPEEPETYERGTDSVFIEWDRRLIWLASNTGLHLLSAPALGDPILEPRPVAEWSLPGLNAGHP